MRTSPLDPLRIGAPSRGLAGLPDRRPTVDPYPMCPYANPELGSGLPRCIGHSAGTSNATSEPLLRRPRSPGCLVTPNQRPRTPHGGYASQPRAVGERLAQASYPSPVQQHRLRLTKHALPDTHARLASICYLGIAPLMPLLRLPAISGIIVRSAARRRGLRWPMAAPFSCLPRAVARTGGNRDAMPLGKPPWQTCVSE